MKTVGALLWFAVCAFGQAPTIDSMVVMSTRQNGTFAAAANKTAELNGASATISSQTDSTAVVVGQLRNNVQDTINLFAGLVSGTGTIHIRYRYKSGKLIWETR